MSLSSANALQKDISLYDGQNWDVIIIGSGPSGAIAALHLASWGHRVLIIDKEQFPREKTCGDALTNDALIQLNKVGLEDEIRAAGHFNEMAILYSPKLPPTEMPRPFVLLKREILDNIIVTKAINAGAAFCRGLATKIISREDGSVQILFKGSEMGNRAKIAILATGSNLLLPKQAGGILSYKPNAAAIRCYVHSSFRINELIAFYDPAIDSGYGWIFPMGMNTYNVGWISFYNDIHSIKPNLSKTFYKFAESFPHAKKLFKSGNMISILQGASLRWGLNGAIPIFPKNVLNIGEIIGSTLPITGEGISYAMNTGERAAMAVHDALVSDNMNKLEQYSNWIDAELRPKQAEKLKRWVRFCKAYKNN